MVYSLSCCAYLPPLINPPSSVNEADVAKVEFANPVIVLFVNVSVESTLTKVLYAFSPTSTLHLSDDSSNTIFAGLLLRNTPLLIAALVGLILVWQLEMLTGQLRVDTNEYLLTVIFIGLTFFPVIFAEVEILESVINLFYILLLVLSLVMVLFQDLSISKIGNTVFSTIFSFTIVSFIMSEVFFENLNHIIYLFLSLFFLKTIATFLNVQFSNFQYFFNFFAVLVVMIGVTSFYDFQFIYIILGSVSTALSVVFVNFLILKIRYEFEHISELTNEIYLYDYLIAFLFSLYFVDSLNIINGLF